MIVEILEMHQTWLNAATVGANAQIALVTKNAAHAAPPALVEIVDEMSDEHAATEEGMPGNPPCLGMRAELVGDAADPAVNDMGDGLVEVALRYITREKNAMLARRNAAYSARAILRSLRLLMEGGQEASRQLRGVQLITRIKLEFVTLYQPVGDGFCSGLFQATYIYRDVGFLP